MMQENTTGPTPVEIHRAEHSPGIHSSLVIVPAPELRQKCAPVDVNIIPQVQIDWVLTMLDVLKSCRNSGINTISISAPQVGIRCRCFMIDSPALSLVAFNPVITKTVGEFESIEGCLSFPKGVFYSVRRAKIVKFHYINGDGIEHSVKLRDRFAAIIQHEIDHLDGILIDDNGKRCSPYGR